MAKFAEPVQGGVIHPLTVRPIPKKPGRFAIISGRDRSEAAKLIGRKKLSCRIVENCSDDQARMISIYENVTRSSVSATEKKQGLAELVVLTKADLRLHPEELEPSGVPSGKPGPKPTLDATAVKIAAEKAGVSKRYVQMAVKEAKENTSEPVAQGAVGEREPKATEQPSGTHAEEPVKDNAEQRFTKIAGEADRFRKHIDTFLKSIADGGPDVLAKVDLDHVFLIFLLVPVWKRLFLRIPKDLRLKAIRKRGSMPPAAGASRPESSDRSAAAAPTSDQRLLNPVVPENPAAPASDNPTT